MTQQLASRSLARGDRYCVARTTREVSDCVRRAYATAAAATGGGVLPAPIPGDKRVREQRPRQTEDLGIHILKAAGTRLQQGVPLTLFIHLRSSGAGAAVAGPERMARATRYLYNKPGDNVRVRGTTPPKTLRGVESID